jgi:hypothetical protein
MVSVNVCVTVVLGRWGWSWGRQYWLCPRAQFAVQLIWSLQWASGSHRRLDWSAGQAVRLNLLGRGHTILTLREDSVSPALFDSTLLVNTRSCPAPFIPTLQMPTHAWTRHPALVCWQSCAMCLPAALTIIAVLQCLSQPALRWYLDTQTLHLPPPVYSQLSYRNISDTKSKIWY